MKRHYTFILLSLHRVELIPLALCSVAHPPSCFSLLALALFSPVIMGVHHTASEGESLLLLPYTAYTTTLLIYPL